VRTLKDILLNTARMGTLLQKRDGSFPPGHNGLWNVLETPVRNTAHWLITCAKAYELSGNKSFRNAVRKAGQFLLSSEARPFKATYHIMAKKGWATNGIVGQAWVIEALVAAYFLLDDETYLSVAQELVSGHHFNRDFCLWHMRGLDGTLGKEHTTLNQQIWFTAMAHKIGLLTKDKAILEKSAFSANGMGNICKFNGRFIHMIVNEKVYWMKDKRKMLSWKWKFVRNWKHYDTLSKGYISYSLYPLALLHESDQSLKLWESEGFRKCYLASLRYLEKHVFEYKIDDNPYAFSYHPTGFEAAYIFEQFGKYYGTRKRSSQDWITKQMNQHFDRDQMLMSKDTCDPNTLAARFYEVVRLADLKIKIH
jgi:hypothetical protein